MCTLKWLILLLSFSSTTILAGQLLERRIVPEYVISEAVFPVSAATLRKSLLDGLRANKEKDDIAYQTFGFISRDAADRKLLAPAIAEDSTNAVYAEEYFRNPAHAEDIYVHFMGEPVMSSYYYSYGRPLDYSVTFSISISATNNGSARIIIKTIESEVFFGKELNLHAMGFVPKPHVVPPSPLDQYKLLLYAAHLVNSPLTPLKQDTQ